MNSPLGQQEFGQAETSEFSVFESIRKTFVEELGYINVENGYRTTVDRSVPVIRFPGQIPSGTEIGFHLGAVSFGNTDDMKRVFSPACDCFIQAIFDCQETGDDYSLDLRAKSYALLQDIKRVLAVVGVKYIRQDNCRWNIIRDSIDYLLFIDIGEKIRQGSIVFTFKTLIRTKKGDFRGAWSSYPFTSNPLISASSAVEAVIADLLTEFALIKKENGFRQDVQRVVPAIRDASKIQSFPEIGVVISRGHVTVFDAAFTAFDETTDVEVIGCTKSYTSTDQDSPEMQSNLEAMRNDLATVWATITTKYSFLTGRWTILGDAKITPYVDSGDGQIFGKVLLSFKISMRNQGVTFE